MNTYEVEFVLNGATKIIKADDVLYDDGVYRFWALQENEKNSTVALIHASMVRYVVQVIA